MTKEAFIIEMAKILFDSYVKLNELRVKYPEHAHFLFEPTKLIEKEFQKMLNSPMIAPGILYPSVSGNRIFTEGS